MSQRVNPLDNLNDFTPRTPDPSARASVERLDQVSVENNFPSRSARTSQRPSPDRRYRTGRNRQFNIKATDDTINRMTRLADQLREPMGAVFERAVAALEEKLGQTNTTK